MEGPALLLRFRFSSLLQFCIELGWELQCVAVRKTPSEDSLMLPRLPVIDVKDEMRYRMTLGLEHAARAPFPATWRPLRLQRTHDWRPRWRLQKGLPRHGHGQSDTSTSIEYTWSTCSCFYTPKLFSDLSSLFSALQHHWSSLGSSLQRMDTITSPTLTVFSTVSLRWQFAVLPRSTSPCSHLSNNFFSHYKLW